MRLSFKWNEKDRWKKVSPFIGGKYPASIAKREAVRICAKKRKRSGIYTCDGTLS